MERYELIAPCHFGLEAVLKKEVVDLGYEVTEVENGRVTFIGDAEAICRANIFLRTAERVLLKVGSFKAVERLFIDENGTFHSFGNPELIDNAIQIVRIDTVKLHFFLGNHTENTSSIQNPCTAK